ncbi:MAG: alkaline phosphatase [Deltaproteobacteria bacterium]|nr:alkaline phosphatase [Candidatus Anaeroferrophillus wilburensis]MBN2887817.1 alkaline phosphatase [Deltaproteobacteria bacterium]
MKKNLITSIVVSAFLFSASMAGAAQLKYVFFFLGDGMANSHIQATEAYLTTVNGGSATLATDLLQPENRLNISKMPVVGMQTTYDAHALMTDSASSATAFACGLKTMSGVIGMDETKATSYKSIAQLAHESGKKVGIISSVSLDHATPAAYYASVASRGSYGDIDIQLAESGYEFFGGGGLKVANADDLRSYGYEVLNDRDSIMALKDNPQDKVICINPWLQDSAAMPYDIDRPDTNLSLAEMTEVAIANLYAKQQYKQNHRRSCNSYQNNGFFLMVEGGKIDWASHANDARATIGDMLDFDNAVGVALEFYNQHPYETLIVVTGDHETGGMTIGHATTAYKAHYDRLLGQVNSFQYFGVNQWADHKASWAASTCPNVADPDNLQNNAEMLQLMYDVFGLDWDELNDYQKEKLEDAYDKSLCGANDNTAAENQFLYGSYNPIIVTITHILNEQASIGWTSYSHTGVPVPIFAQGVRDKLFAGFYDNTDIAKKLANAMGLPALPIVK